VLRNAALEGVADRVEVVEADARSMPFEPGTFDVVVSMLCLHNIDRGRNDALGEIVRVLKPGGSILISDFADTREASAFLASAGLDVEHGPIEWGTFPFSVSSSLASQAEEDSQTGNATHLTKRTGRRSEGAASTPRTQARGHSWLSKHERDRGTREQATFDASAPGRPLAQGHPRPDHLAATRKKDSYSARSFIVSKPAVDPMYPMHEPRLGAAG
jgi:SAM-dependent methyltransferase